MAASFGGYSILLSLALVSMLIAPSSAGRNANLRQVCSRTHDRSRCMRLLVPETRYSDGDARSIAEAAINLAYRKAREITSSSGDDSAAWRFSCTRNYGKAIRGLDRSRRLLNDGDYRRVARQVDETVEEVRRCRRRLDGFSGDYDFAKRRNKEFEVLCSAVKVCAKILSSDD